MLSPTEAKKYPKYASFFQPCRQLVDLGCGQGKFLGLMNVQGRSVLGVDQSPAALAALREQGLPAVKADALSFLRRAKPGSFDGLFCSNLLEHMEMKEVLELLQLLSKKLRRGGRVAFATANPRCLGLVAGVFWEDPQHKRFYPWPLLKAELEARGFDVLWAQEDEDTRPQSAFRRLLRWARTVIVGDHFGPPEVGVMAVRR